MGPFLPFLGHSLGGGAIPLSVIVRKVSANLRLFTDISKFTRAFSRRQRHFFIWQ